MLENTTVLVLTQIKNHNYQHEEYIYQCTYFEGYPRIETGIIVK